MSSALGFKIKCFEPLEIQLIHVIQMIHVIAMNINNHSPLPLLGDHGFHP